VPRKAHQHSAVGGKGGVQLQRSLEPDEAQRLRDQVAQYAGFVARLYGHLHLSCDGRETDVGRFDAVRKWLDEEVAKTQALDRKVRAGRSPLEMPEEF